MIKIHNKGNFNKFERFLNKATGKGYLNTLDNVGSAGVAALAAATPKDSGDTANMWGHEIDHDSEHTTISWTNSNQNGNFNVALGLQYGHGTGTGGWVPGEDYINPAIEPIFKAVGDAIWSEVTSK